ncbi:MAG: choice-of-anchor O protein [Planctomycetota bacterium]|nr:choice-of-anchor O protein [Planctomycetota bacterium]
MYDRRKKLLVRAFATVAAVCTLTAIGVVWAAQQQTRLQFTQQKSLSVTSTLTGAIDGENSIKGKLLQLQYETSPGSGVYENVLISVYSDSGVSTMNAWEFDGKEYLARDVFVTRSIDGGVNWSQPVCVSVDPTSGLTFAQSSTIDADPDGILGPVVSQAYPGDCEKPQVFGSTQTGRNAVITFHCAYDMDGQGANQRIVEYPEYGGISRAYHTTYAIKTSDGGVTWSDPQQLGDASRDAKQVAARGSGAGIALVWQEDPHGLQPGEGDGPGDGGSGAKASQGTDVWYTALKTADFATTDWPAPMRITDNAIKIDQDGLENGPERSTRPQVAIIGQTAIVAYEEVKGLEKFDDGKYIRYHTFPAFNYPFVSAMTHVDSGLDYAMTGDLTKGQGWIVSKPDENARRVRLLVQGQPGPTTGMLIGFIYKQGAYTAGGPSDIMFRVGRKNAADASSTGLRPEDIYPTINFSSTATYPLPIGLETGSDRQLAFSSAPATNLSSILGLDADTSDDSFESGRSHRGVMDGDRLAVGYSWTSNWGLMQATDLDNENFYIRRSFDGGMTWDERRNISNITDTKLSVREPRMFRPPTTPNPAETTNSDIFFVAYGTQVNQYDHMAVRTLNRDIYMTRTTDYGNSYEQVINFTSTGNVDDENQESQPVTNAAGDTVHVVWQQENFTTNKFNTQFSTATIETYTVDSAASDDDDGGCSTGGSGTPWLLMAGLLALGALSLRGRARRS